MAPVVLVHWRVTGGWKWWEVVTRLRVVEHEVATPTLTSLGERVHFAHPRCARVVPRLWVPML